MDGNARPDVDSTNGDARVSFESLSTWSASTGRPAKTSEVIAREIANRISEGRLAAGTRLPPERDMIAAFAVGRSTIREALRLLETRGVLTIKRGPGGGPVVRRPTAEDFGEALTLVLQFEGASLRDVIDARQALEPTMARLAAERISDDQLALLQDTVDTMRKHRGDHQVFVEQNWLFHRTVSQAASSVALQVFIDSIKSIADGAILGIRYSSRRHSGVADAHQRIVDALRAQDPDQARQAMQHHLDEASNYWATRHPDLMSQALRWVR